MRRAFSLIELTLVLVVIGIILGVGAPAVGDAVAHERRRGARQGIAEQLELVLKEGRNRLVPVELDVDEDGITWAFNPQASVLMKFDSCEGSAGISSGCFLRQSKPCEMLFDSSVSDVCLPMRATVDALLRAGDLDGAIELWRPIGLAASREIEHLSDRAVGGDVGRIAHPLITFDITFDAQAEPTDVFLITPLGRVIGGRNLARQDRTIRLGDGTRLVILDSGVVQVEQP
jgi:prepilin-type N-terminal cleavage/methylation domain-containing protein